MKVPTLAGDDVVLRSWSAGDAGWYVAVRDEAVYRWTRESPSLTSEEAAAGIAATKADPGRGAFAITDPGSGELLGNVGVLVHDDAVELSYWVAPDARGRGVASAALATAAFWAANTFGKPMLELLTHPQNIASQRVAQNAGFVPTGLLASRDTCADDDGMVARYERRVSAATD